MEIYTTPSLQQINNLRSEIEQLKLCYQKQQVDLETLRTLGQKLWKMLALEHLPQCLSITGDQQLHDVPWEALYHPTQGFLALSENFHLVRQFSHNSIQNSTLTISCDAPLRILLFTAHVHPPSQQQSLLLELEQLGLRTTLFNLIAAGKVQLYAPDDGHFSTLCTLLQQSWSVVILSGHGSSQPEGFWFEGEDAPVFMTTTLIKQAFNPATITCVIIAACQSLSLAMCLYQLGIPHVIGMWETLLDRAACRLIQTLCGALANEFSVNTALYQARIAMTQLLEQDEMWARAQSPDVGQWCLPMLFSQDASQSIVKYDNFYSTRIVTMPYPPELFVGRRPLLQELSATLHGAEVNNLWLWGGAGVGKTALARQLAWHLSECGLIVIYHLIGHDNFQATLQQYFDNSGKSQLDSLHSLTQQPCLLWIDGSHCDANTLSNVEILARWRCPNLRILVSTRGISAKLPNFRYYQVQSIDYPDFYRYMQAKGLPYQSIQLRLIHQAIRGNFHTLRLLENFPIPSDIAQFWQNLAILQRYARAQMDD